MLSEIEVKDAVYALLKNVGIDEEISGKIYKEQRPMNSTKEDVEISVLASSVAQNQDFIVNVNVFVPDIKRKDEMIENTPRLRELCQTFLEALEYVADGAYLFILDSQRVLKYLDADLHAINNRLNVRFNSEN